MVQILDKWCIRCGKDTLFANGKCVKCTEALKRAKIAAWNELTVDQRLNDLRDRVEKLEAGPPTF